MDRRIQRTRGALQNALTELILTKGYESITIKEITEHANVNHATFYLHYKNKDHILEMTLRETHDALVADLAQDERCCIDSNAAAIRIFEHAAAHAPIYRMLLSANGGVNSAVIRTRNYIASLVQRQLTALAPRQLGGIPYEMIAQHTAGALLSVISWWLEHNMPYSASQMAEMVGRLSSPAAMIGAGLSFQISISGAGSST